MLSNFDILQITLKINNLLMLLVTQRKGNYSSNTPKVAT